MNDLTELQKSFVFNDGIITHNFCDNVIIWIKGDTVYIKTVDELLEEVN